MRILMLDNELPPLGGGTGTVNLTLLHHFAFHNNIVIDLITSALGGEKEEEKFSKQITIYKVPVWNKNIHHSSNRELMLYAMQATYVGAKFQRNLPYDFCFAWSAVPAGGVALMLNKLYKLPYLVRVSGPDIPGFEQRYNSLYSIITPFIRAVWRRATNVIAKCQQEVDMIHAVDKDVRVDIIPNGVDLSRFQAGSPAPNHGPLHIFCAARLIERKGQHYLIRAVKLLRDEGVDVDLSLAGTGDSLNDYQKLSKNLGVYDHVKFLGYIPREDIPKYYQASDVFCLPSYNEGMSLAALEALGAGLPLILTRTGGSEKLVEEGVNGYIHAWGDVDTLVGYLRQLSYNRPLLQQMGVASRKKAYQFSWESITAQYLNMFTRYGRI